MALIDDTLKVAKKTHIEGIRWWLKREYRENECPMSFKAAGDTPNCNDGLQSHPVCLALFPAVKKRASEGESVCPCNVYRMSHVTRRARELVKAWEEKQ